MPAYTVTAENRYFWQVLVVEAPDAKAAAKAFDAFLAGEDNQRSENYEFSEAEREMSSQRVTADSDDYDAAGQEETLDRDDYRYGFRDENVTEFEGYRNWSGTPSAEVQVLDVGGNG